MKLPLGYLAPGIGLVLFACSSAPSTQSAASNAATPAAQAPAPVVSGPAQVGANAAAAYASASAKYAIPPARNAPNRPKWIDLQHPFQIQNGFAVAMGYATTQATDEGYIIAANIAKDAMCVSIEQRFDLAFQDSEEGSSVDHKQLKEISADACKAAADAAKQGKRYWEKVATTANNGDRIIVYRVFVNVVIPEDKFKKLVCRAVKNQEGKGSIPKDYTKMFRKERWPLFARGD
ncbi:MAG: hypothetical protein JST80_13875 [Bdellovibrionales bacterium]|nr:hypothetical protein [Bdellovibrionales bacterium]